MKKKKKKRRGKGFGVVWLFDGFGLLGFVLLLDEEEEWGQGKRDGTRE